MKFDYRGDNESIFKEKSLLLYKEWIKDNPDFYSVDCKPLGKDEIESMKKESRIVEFAVIVTANIPPAIFYYWLNDLVFTLVVLFFSWVSAAFTIYSVRRKILNLENGGQKKIVKGIFVNHHVKNIDESDYNCLNIGEAEFVTTKSITEFKIGDYLEIQLLPKTKVKTDSILKISRLETQSSAYLNLLQTWKKMELSHNVKLLR